MCTQIGFCIGIQNNLSSEFVFFMYWTRNSMNNLSSYCRLVDARISASEKDLPVPATFFLPYKKEVQLDTNVWQRAGWFWQLASRKLVHFQIWRRAKWEIFLLNRIEGNRWRSSIYEIGIRNRITLSSTFLVGILTRIATFYGNEKFHMYMTNVSRKLIVTGILMASGFSDQKSCVCLHH